MRPIELKISDLASVTDYTRFQLDGLLKQVFAREPLGKKSGAQRTFSPQDLLVAAVACALEQKYGIERKRIASVARSLRSVLIGPRPANRDARLLITFVPPAVTFIDSDGFIPEGLVLQLGPLFAAVDEYLGVSGREGPQPILPLPPAIVSGRRTGPRNR